MHVDHRWWCIVVLVLGGQVILINFKTNLCAVFINVLFFFVCLFVGTFITLDICISRLEDVGTADIRGTVEKIRSQRAYSIQMPDQYVFCHLALIEYAIFHNFLNSAIDLAGFDDQDDVSD